MPPTDEAALDIAPGDEELLAAQAIAVLLHRSAVTEGDVGRRRSSRDPRIAAVRPAQLDADRLMDLRARG